MTLELQELVELQVHKDLKGRKGPKVMELVEHQELAEHKVNKVMLELQELVEHQV